MNRYADDSMYLLEDPALPAEEMLLEQLYSEVIVPREAPAPGAHGSLLPMMYVDAGDSEDCDADAWPLAIGESARAH